MSEQNIWNNTYVLGDVSATTLSAGNGIKITTDEPGVIKVSNDETVLWSGNNITADMPLSENMRNFEEIKFYYGYNGNDANNQVSITSFDTYSSGCKLIFYTKDEDPNFKIRTSNLSFSDNQISVNYAKNCRLTISTAGNINCSVASGQGPSIYKIIGCNRKQNGGN